jgi:hypothetical protein
MRKWLLLILLTLLCLVPLSLAGAEPFLSTQGPIMERNEAMSIIVVNERSLFIDPSTTITDEKGRTLDFHHLRSGQWVSVEAEPDDASRMVAHRIILIRKK